MKLILIVVATLLAAFGATTWWALESGGVAVIETRAPDGTVRSTHVWYAEPNEELSKLETAVLDLARVGFPVRRILEVIPEPDADIYAALELLADRGVLEL